MSADTRPVSGAKPDMQGSYEGFETHPRIQAVDRFTAAKATPAHIITDQATGTGAAIRHLFEQGKVLSPFQIIGVDVDEKAMDRAAEKLIRYVITANAGGDKETSSITFIAGQAESVPQIATGSQDLVTFFNSWHLTDLPQAFRESARILRPDGEFLGNSAYVKDFAYVGQAGRVDAMFIAQGRINAGAEGHKNIPKPVGLFNYTPEDIVRIAEESGFPNIQTDEYTVQMDASVFWEIFGYEGYTMGALPGVPHDVASKALRDAIDPVFAKLGVSEVPRRWLTLKARKPQSLPAQENVVFESAA